jgi:hypothetical protein
MGDCECGGTRSRVLQPDQDGRIIRGAMTHAYWVVSCKTRKCGIIVAKCRHGFTFSVGPAKKHTGTSELTSS